MRLADRGEQFGCGCYDCRGQAPPGWEVTVEALITLILLIPLTAIGIAAYIVLRRSISAEIKKARMTTGDSTGEVARITAQDRADARALYERIIREKLEVIKTAVAMGADEQQLRQLDQRLEQLVGTEKLQALLETQESGAPPLTDELLNLDLSRELENLRRGQETQAE